jgi:hypothetical protein
VDGVALWSGGAVRTTLPPGPLMILFYSFIAPARAIASSNIDLATSHSPTPFLSAISSKNALIRGETLNEIASHSLSFRKILLLVISVSTLCSYFQDYYFS